jgi:hypothetical protein
MRRTPVRKEIEVCLVDATPTHLGWVKWCLPTGERQGRKLCRGSSCRVTV